MNIEKRILCIDIGYCHTGVAVFDYERDEFVYTEVINTEKGVFSARVGLDDLGRCKKIFLALCVIQERFHFKKAVAEIPHGGAMSSTASRAMAMSKAVLACFVARYDIRLIPVYPHEIKRLVADKGAVEKEIVIAYVSARFGTRLFPARKSEIEHVADAMCLIDVLKYGRSQTKS